MASLDWLNLALRWLHLIAGVAWIGSSFYFIWLDSQLEAPPPGRPEVEGSLWMVHSGGFYQVERRHIGPGEVPRTLHWFKWEAAITWMSGIALLALVYYLTGGINLVDPSVSGISVGAATGLAAGVLLVGWLVYDGLWQSPLARGTGAAATVISLALAGVAAWWLCRVLSGRAAFIHVGALFGTIMVANVWLRILPAQQQMIDATREGGGRQPDFTLSGRAKRRSVHNSYLTFPVLFIMLSNHYPATYAHPLNWLVLLLLVVAGAGVRHLMIAKGGARRWAVVPVIAAAALLFVLTVPKTSQSQPGGSFAAVRAVINARCLSCHSAYPTDSVFRAAPAGVTFDTPETIQRQAERIRVRAVDTQTMPFGNTTGMTDAERALVGRWVLAGATLN